MIRFGKRVSFTFYMLHVTCPWYDVPVNMCWERSLAGMVRKAGDKPVTPAWGPWGQRRGRFKEK